jgi:hypothetical protein
MRRNVVVVALGGAAIVAAVVLIASRASSKGAARATATTATAQGAKTVSPAASPAKRRATTPGLALRASTPGTLPDAAPGAVAFRGYTDDYLDAQPDVVKEHMARERITLDETHELTYFAIMAVESQDWGRVESLTGHPLSKDQRREVWESMMARSQEMRRQMGEAIAGGADESSRWDTIASVESGYLSDYYRVTGMTPQMLDALLLASVRDQHVNQTIASLSPDNNDPPPVPAGTHGAFVKRDPLHPERAPVPVDQPPPP